LNNEIGKKHNAISGLVWSAEVRRKRQEGSMFIVLTYDINQKRVAKVMKICRKYLIHVQKSVFEGMLTEAELRRLKGDLIRAIDVDADSICIYQMESLRYTSKEQIGIVGQNEHII
jgi:CRISPR-associated protein Cas2